MKSNTTLGGHTYKKPTMVFVMQYLLINTRHIENNAGAYQRTLNPFSMQVAVMPE